MATGTKLMKEISDQFLMCKICLEAFTEPKTLSCLHTFCLACVQQHYDTESNRPTRYTLYTRCVTCPLCRHKTELPTGGVRRLPDNVLVSNLTDVLAKRRGVSKVPPCDICTTDRPRHHDACVKCLDCDKLLCRPCVQLHSSTKVTQGHSLIDLEGQKDIECKAHPEETVRFYCERCEECICVVCTFQQHKDHDVCSFSDGFAKHRVTLEDLLTRSKVRLTGLASRLKVIDQYETLAKEVKERIRDMAISYTAQVRAREKELVRRVDEVLGGAVSQLADSKAWLTDTFHSLQGAVDLTDIVLKDRGLEMLLLKKEIQGKMDGLLGGPLPPEPHTSSLQVHFVPGEVRLGDVLVPGSAEEGEEEEGGKEDTKEGTLQGSKDRDVADGALQPNLGSDSARPSGEAGTKRDTACQECQECAQRKRREASRDGPGTRDRKETKSVYIQTRSQDPVLSGVGAGHFTTTAAQVSLGQGGVSVSHSAMQTHTATVSSRHAATDSAHHPHHYHDISLHVQARDASQARGTVTERQDVRTLTTQTDDSCLRDAHLGSAAATGSTFPNTGAAIAAAFLRHKAPDHDVLTRSWPQARTADSSVVVVARVTRDAEVATDISLGVTATSHADTVTALRRGEVGGGGGGGGDCSRPDLLAETGIAAGPPAPSTPWIRSRKVQTDISALAPVSADGGTFLGDGELDKVLGWSGPVRRADGAPTSPAGARGSRGSRAARAVSTQDVGVMTPFTVRLVADCADKNTGTEAAPCRAVGVMTSLDTRDIYIQTRGPRLTSTATGTDYEGQSSKGTSTTHVTTVDSETSTPRVTHDSRTTWTEAVLTSERASSTVQPATSEVATLTSHVQTADRAVQWRAQGVTAGTNTTATRLVHHQCQTTPSLCTRGTMPDPVLSPTPIPTPTPTPTTATATASTVTPPESVMPVPLCAVPGPPSPPDPVGGVGVVGAVDVVDVGVDSREQATDTALIKTSTRAVGPDCLMQSSRAVSTDTLHLTQVRHQETATPTVRMVDDWTHTPQPQMINTGVTPPHPALLEVGVATTPITLMDQATYTEVTTLRESGTETCVVVCDSETLTEKTTSCDAQTEVEISMESQGTAMEGVQLAEGGCMTDEVKVNTNSQGTAMEGVQLTEGGCMADEVAREPLAPKDIKDSESQCLSPVLLSKEVNTTRYRRKAKEVQTSYSYMECVLCQHPDKLALLGADKTFTDTSTDPSPPDTHDVATMALSCLASSPGLACTGVQTSPTPQCDKAVATAFDFDDDLACRPYLGLECQDAATSTESLPYIGLLSEIDVDELIVFPEAHFTLVSDDDDDSVSMVDGETLTEVLDYVEVGTQTLLPASGTGGPSAEPDPTLCRPEDDCSKVLVSIGVNTMPKVTFEKETSTPIRHLFSKGTMTFFVAKMDKATSTISQTRGADGRSGGAGPGGRVVKEASRQRAVQHKVTMTSRAEQRDMAVGTDTTLLDGRITQCISKLRNVSQRLNSPTLRKTLEGEAFFGQSFLTNKQKDSSLLASPASPKLPSSPKVSLDDTNTVRVSPPRDDTAEEQQRQAQLQTLLVETEAVLKSKDLSPGRKAQPITTLKPRSPLAPGDMADFASRSLPRQGSLDRQNKVKMGSQTSPTRLPLLRYNSAPGRIATVPAQTLLRKTGQTSPRTSPSKIPVSQKPPAVTSSAELCDPGPDSDSYSTSSSQKVQQRPSLPSISETRTPSSCSETSFLSLESGDSSLNPASVMTSFLSLESGDSSLNPASVMTFSHSRTPSNVTSVSDTASEATASKGSAETLATPVVTSSHSRTPSVSDTASEAMVSKGSAETLTTPDVGADSGDSSSVSSTSTTLTVTPPQGGNASPSSPSKQKKEKKGFMQRLLHSGKKKKDVTADQEKEAAVKQEGVSAPSKPPQPPPSPQTQQKQTAPQKTEQSAKSKNPSRASATLSSSAASATKLPPPPPVSTPVSSRPVSAGSTLQSTKGGASRPASTDSTLSSTKGEASRPASTDSTLSSTKGGASRPTSTDSAHSSVKGGASRPASTDSTLSSTKGGASRPASTDSTLSSTKGGASRPASTDSVHSSVKGGASRPASTDSAHSSVKGGASAGAAAGAMAPHHYPPLPDPNKTSPPPRKPRAFVYVRQRMFSIQQDNVEEAKERKEKEKEEKEKGKAVDKGQIKTKSVGDNDQIRVKYPVKVRDKEKYKDREKSAPSVKAVTRKVKAVKGKEISGVNGSDVGKGSSVVKGSDKGSSVVKGSDNGQGSSIVKKAGKVTVSKSGKAEDKEKKDGRKARGWVFSQ